MLVLGGGGYTIRNVARCWTYETGCLLGHGEGRVQGEGFSIHGIGFRVRGVGFSIHGIGFKV
jgi:acetoin utilization deacetylase AcuC-like enzyme